MQKIIKIANTFFSQNQVGLIITILLAIMLIPNDAFALSGSDIDPTSSILYNLAEQIIGVVERLSLSLFQAISEEFFPLFQKLATIGFIIIYSKYLITRRPPLMLMINFSYALVIAGALAFNAPLFKYVIYDTFFDAMYGMSTFIITKSGEAMGTATGFEINSIAGVFASIDSSFKSVIDFTYEVATNQDWGFSVISNMILAFIIHMLFIFLETYFMIIFTVAILGAHMMIIFMPITIALYPFRNLREYSRNCAKGMLHYGLIMLFACVAAALSIALSGELSQEASRLMAEEVTEIPSSFFVISVMVGLVSIMILKMSSEFASRISNTVGSDLGRATPMIAAAAVTAAKMATKIGGSAIRHGAPAALSTLKAGGSGISSAVGAASSAFRKNPNNVSMAVKASQVMGGNSKS